MFKFLIPVFLFLLPLSALAEEEEEDRNSLLYFCCSKHHYGNPNEIHNGLFYERKIDDTFSFVTGTYRNSLDQQSMVLAGKMEKELSSSWDGFVMAGYVSGYGRAFGISPGLEYKDTIQFYIIPGVVYGIGFRIFSW